MRWGRNLGGKSEMEAMKEGTFASFLLLQEKKKIHCVSFSQAILDKSGLK